MTVDRSGKKTSSPGQLVIRGGHHLAIDLGEYEITHSADPLEIGENIAFALLIENPLPVHKYFHDSLSPRRDGDRNVRAEMPEKFIRHPRGGAEVLSRYAVSNL